MTTPMGESDVATPLGMGLVGAGGFGTFCLQAFAEMREVSVVAVADRDLERAAAIAPPGAAVYGDLATLLADPAVDIVHIATPPAQHGAQARQAAEAGKHLFVEKPLAISLDEARNVVRAARRAGVKLSVNYVLRWHPLHQLAAALVHAAALGPLQLFSLENFATDDRLPPEHWFWDPAQSGGIHVEHGVHFFDLCNHLAGQSPTAVSGSAQRRDDGRLDRVAATVIYGDRLLATFYHSFNQIGRFERTTIRLGCARGRLQLDGWIPTRLSVDGVVDENGLAFFRHHFRDLSIDERFSGAQSIFHHGGIAEKLVASVRATATYSRRQLAYKEAIQAGLRDLVNAIYTGGPPTIGPPDALLSLAVAVAASRPHS